MSQMGGSSTSAVTLHSLIRLFSVPPNFLPHGWTDWPLGVGLMPLEALERIALGCEYGPVMEGG